MCADKQKFFSCNFYISLHTIFVIPLF